MRCTFCGRPFDDSAAAEACKSCALFGGCRVVCCPHCGYKSPAEPRLIRWLRNLKGRLGVRGASGGTSPEVGPLSDGRVGCSGTVAFLTAHDQKEVQKLMAMGILPGEPIRLLRRFPSFVFQVGLSQFTVDRQLAERIHVRWAPRPTEPPAHPGRHRHGHGHRS